MNKPPEPLLQQGSGGRLPNGGVQIKADRPSRWKDGLTRSFMHSNRPGQ